MGGLCAGQIKKHEAGQAPPCPNQSSFFFILAKRPFWPPGFRNGKTWHSSAWKKTRAFGITC